MDTPTSSTESVEDVLLEARTLMGLQYRLATRMRTLSLLFRLVAYVIGIALLLRPFGLSTPNWLAATFGLLLLVATFLDHHVRPDVKFINAKGRFLQLNRAVTTGEESLNRPDAEDVRSQMARVIDEVERAQHLDYAMMRRPLTSTMPARPVPPTSG